MSRFIDIHTHHPTPEIHSPQGVGIHPWLCEQSSLPDESLFESADLIGEIGLDFAYPVNREVQEEVFRTHLEIAQRMSKPVVLHCVKAFERIMKILDEYRLRAVIFHGFIGSHQQAERALEKGYYLSFGERTARSSKTIEALRNTPLDRIFVESDESGLKIENIYTEIARLKDVELETLQSAILENYNRIFD